MVKLFIIPIKFYRYFISPLFPPSCRFQPTCSEYAIDIIKEKGVLKGTFLALKRISKCHPWN
ncbi:MAG: membrane protein insertion efficiency factor YidD [Gammaproteobacteria bacterium]|nr:membrane protein insertion efficiency factor YidD [Gammaproteobacteria bacterium]